MKPLALIGLLALLVACGADGAPERPGTAPGLTVTGGAEIGITGGNG
ncbi:argininosuccinate lyase [Actibacterium sp. MT2.3-13A]|nr:argininosuccinate lyase [Actibacterium sp. MT2.3-13A]